MASIYKRGKTWYTCIEINGKKIRKAVSRDENTAKVKLGQLIQMSVAKTYGEIPDDTPLSLFLDDDRKERTALQFSHCTITADKDAVNRLTRYFPIQTLQDINPDLLNLFIVKIMTVCECGTKFSRYTVICPKCKKSAHKTSLATVVNTLIRIKGIMYRAELKNLVKPQNWKRVHKLKCGGRDDFYEPEELGRILDLCDLIYTRIVVLGFRFGLRVSEVREALWKNLSLENNSLRIWQTKVKKWKTIPLWPDVRENLIRWQKKSKSKYIIGSTKEKDRNWRPENNTISSHFGRLVKRAKINHGCFHVLRHSYATHLISNGVPLWDVKEYMGHQTTKTTEGYIQYKPSWKPDQQNGSHYQLPSVRGLS